MTTRASRRALALMLATSTCASAQPLAAVPTERTLADFAGASTVHYSIDQFGPLYNASEYVCVGYRETLAGGRMLHVARFDGVLAPISESTFLPPGGTHMAAYSVDTLANGDLLIAGEIDDQYSGANTHNVFVTILSRDLSTVRWTKLLPGTLGGVPAVTARELHDGSIIIAHNEWNAGGDLAPSFALLTRLDPAGNLIWGRRYRIPNAPIGQIQIADVRQEPGGGNLWAAGWCSPSIFAEAMLLNIDLNTGCPLGEGAWKYPHPDYDFTTFTAIQFDVRRDTGQFTMVAAGMATTTDINAPRYPRLVDVPAFGGGANWDRVYTTQLTPAPTALAVRRVLPGVQFTIAGTTSPLGSPPGAAALIVDDNAPALARRESYSVGGPLSSALFDISDDGARIGSREIAPGLHDSYSIARYGSDCATRGNAPLGNPGSLSFAFPDCLAHEHIIDIPLMNLGSQSADTVLCERRPNLNGIIVRP